MDITTWQYAISAGIEPHVHGGFPSRGLVIAREKIKEHGLCRLVSLLAQHTMKVVLIKLSSRTPLERKPSELLYILLCTLLPLSIPISLTYTLKPKLLKIMGWKNQLKSIPKKYVILSLFLKNKIKLNFNQI
jgi:hypothetical protein